MDRRKRKPQNSDHEFEMPMGTRFAGIKLMPKETLNLDIRLYESIVQDHVALPRVCVHLMAMILHDNEIYIIKHHTKSWLTVIEAADIPYDLEVRGPNGIFELTRQIRLELQNLCGHQQLGEARLRQ
ncbi:hypothetical protein ACFE04_028944 [Oxalis oulophora]